jgi:carboxyl-terminal processing protease
MTTFDPQNTPLKKIIAPIGLVFAFLIVFYSGFSFGQSNLVEAGRVNNIVTTLNGNKDRPEAVDFTLFWKAWNIVNEKYVKTRKATSTATDQDRIYGAIKGMVDSMGDPYTTFFPPQQALQFQTEIDGNFEGVGMEMGMKEGILTVITPLKGSPAEKAGIKIGDKILKINGQVANMSIDEAIKAIRGKKGTTVELTIMRAGLDKPIEYKIVRDVINLPTLDTKIDQKNGIFIIHLYTFSAQSANLFRTALRDFVNSGTNKLILDLRGNPGGFLDASIDIASWFLAPGQVVVREDYGKGKPETVEKSFGYNIFNDSLKMVILIDGGSASASEILAGALSEHGKAKLVGTKTFGKGSVQELINITPDTALKVTIARWLTPNGKSISEEGLAPDVEVKVTEDDIKNQRDPQMEKAIELLKN